jgi:hypothetical protein
MAWFVALLLSPYNNGKMLDPNNLLPELFQEQRREMTEEEAKEELSELKKKLGVE